MNLSNRTQEQLLANGYSRRHFGRIIALLSAGASMPMYNEASLAHAQLSRLPNQLPEGAVKINSNENPDGPAPAALEALMKVAKDGGRYQYEETYEMLEVAAKLEGLTADYILPYPGSSLGLHHGVITNTSPERGLVTAEPGYEAAARAAEFIGSPVVRVPIRADGAHDVVAMVKEAKKMNAGLIYICNPNNPTGTPTPRADIEYVLANKPKGTVLLLDEAYIHFSEEPLGTDLVKRGDDIIVLRTFSKVYGMAGLRAGFMCAKPEILTKAKGFSSGALPVTGMAAAKASLEDADLVPMRRKKTAAIRADVLAFLDEHGFAHTASVSNKFMVDVRMPVEQFISAMAEQKVFVGRPWSAWPTWNRVTVGTEEEMVKFKAAFLKVVKT